jgi:predicted AlkP superfamily pyrophosphatase or phosphodiesterase
MQIKMRINIALLTLFFSLISFSVFSEKNFKAKNIFLVVMDGPRYSESWGDPQHKNIYFLATYMAPQGVFYKNFFNRGLTLTNPGHAAMATGFYQDIDNDGNIMPDQPTYLQRWLKKTGASPEKAWLIMSKGKIAVLQNTSNPEWHDCFLPSQNCGVNGLGVKAAYRSDAETFQQVLKIMKNHHPNLVMVNFRQPDSAGHDGNWKAYLSGMQATDGFIYNLWNQIQKDPFYKDKTAFFVTNDHGRHLDGHEDGFVSHGDDCEGCRHISLLALGPDFKKGFDVNAPGELIDIPVTIARMLDMDIPGSKGRFLNELFLDADHSASEKKDKQQEEILRESREYSSIWK